MDLAIFYCGVEEYTQESVDALRHALTALYNVREIEKIMVTIAQHYREEGIAIGKAEGMTEGEAKGQIKSVILFLESRFGKIPAATQKKLASLRDAHRIEKTIKQAATCQSLKEFQKAL